MGIEIQPLSKEKGGELAMFIERVHGETLECSCGEKIVLGDTSSPRGYEHDGGLKDKNETKWWLFYKCPGCGYEYSFRKISSKILTE